MVCFMIFDPFWKTSFLLPRNNFSTSRILWLHHYINGGESICNSFSIFHSAMLIDITLFFLTFGSSEALLFDLNLFICLWTLMLICESKPPCGLLVSTHTHSGLHWILGYKTHTLVFCFFGFFSGVLHD